MKGEDEVRQCNQCNAVSLVHSRMARFWEACRGKLNAMLGASSRCLSTQQVYGVWHRGGAPAGVHTGA